MTDTYCSSCVERITWTEERPVRPLAPQPRFSDRQMVSIAAAAIGLFVGLMVLAWLADPFTSGLPQASEAAVGKLDCLAENVTTGGSTSDFDECSDQVDRELRMGAYEPWHEQHPVWTSLAAGLVTFFVIAAGGRLFMR